MTRPNTSNYVWGTIATIGGLSLHFYYMRELAASMILFGLMSFALSLVVLGVFLIWYAGKQVAIRVRPAPSQDADAPLPRPLASPVRS